MRVAPHANLTITLLRHHSFGDERLIDVRPDVPAAEGHGCIGSIAAKNGDHVEPCDRTTRACPAESTGLDNAMNGAFGTDWPGEEGAGPMTEAQADFGFGAAGQLIDIMA